MQTSTNLIEHTFAPSGDTPQTPLLRGFSFFVLCERERGVRPHRTKLFDIGAKLSRDTAVCFAKKYQVKHMLASQAIWILPRKKVIFSFPFFFQLRCRLASYVLSHFSTSKPKMIPKTI